MGKKAGRAGVRRESSALYALFFLSGAAALIYEVLWMRRFAVFLGATAPAVAAALVAFFAGFGLGSYLFGRFAPRFTRPLRVFAILEIVIAASAPAVGLWLQGMQPVLSWLSDAPGDNAALQLAARIAVAIVSVLIPAIAMGGTLPVLTHFVAARAESLGVRAGGLYAVNTFGACAGALAVPTMLLPTLGATGALGAAITINLAVVAGALRLDRVTPEPAGLQPSTFKQTRRPSRETLVLATSSGAIALALEALASRAFALVHENSVYSFATVVAVLLAGFAGGAALARSALRRRISSRAVASAGWAGAGLWMVLLPAMFVGATGLNYVTGGGLLTHETRLALLAGALLLVPSVLLGLVLPALMQEGGDDAGEGGPAVGSILAANTAGAMVGPLLALFVLAPSVGLWTAVSIVGASASVGAMIAARGAGRILRTTAVAAAATIVAFVITAPASLPRLKLSARDRLLHVSEGAFGSVAIVEQNGHRRIKLNNFYVLGGTHAAGDERLQGHIPLLVHPQPRRVAFLGLGTGISFSAIRFHPIEEALALELVPEIVGAARDWFGDANLSVLSDPRVRVRADDARGYVGATRDRFDVVVGDLVVPWRRGESSLYTRESFEAVRRVLAPGGLYCQWIPLFQISEAAFDSIAASFLDVFPQTTLWRGDFSAGEPALALIGHTGQDPFDAARADARSRAFIANPDRDNPYLSHQAGLWLYFVGPLNASDHRLRSAPRNYDANPWVELSSSRLHLRIQSREATPFVGRPLKNRLDVLRSAPLTGTAAASLRAEHLEWRERGAEIWAASLLSFEGDNAAADRLALGAIARLPTEIQTAVLGSSRR